MYSVTNKIISNIECIIAEKGIKKRNVAEKIGLTAQQFSDMLRGRRTIKAADVILLCDALNVEPNELFEYKQGA